MYFIGWGVKWRSSNRPDLHPGGAFMTCTFCYDHGVLQATGHNGELVPAECPGCGGLLDKSSYGIVVQERQVYSNSGTKVYNNSTLLDRFNSVDARLHFTNGELVPLECPECGIIDNISPNYTLLATILCRSHWQRFEAKYRNKVNFPSTIHNNNLTPVVAKS